MGAAPSTTADPAAVEALLATRHPWVSDWPFIRPGVCLTYLGPHFVLLTGEGLTGESYDAYLEQVDCTCAGQPVDMRTACIFHFAPNSWWDSLSLKEKSARMKQWASVVDKHAERLNRATAMSVNIPQSALARAFLRTVLTLRPATLPTTIVSSAEEAWTCAKREFPLDVPLHLAAHEQLVSRYVPDLKETLYRRRWMG